MSSLLNNIADFFELHQEEDGNWSELLDLHLDRLGYDISEMSMDERSDPWNVVAIGDQMVYVRDESYPSGDSRRYGLA